MRRHTYKERLDVEIVIRAQLCVYVVGKQLVSEE